MTRHDIPLHDATRHGTPSRGATPLGATPLDATPGAQTPGAQTPGATDPSDEAPREDDHVAEDRPLAVVTGASRGLGRAIAEELVDRGWRVVVTARTPATLAATAAALRRRAMGAGRHRATAVSIVAGDVGDAAHRRELAATVTRLGPLELLVNNAGTLGPSPLPRLEDLAPGAFADLLATNVVAQLAVVQALLPHMATGATIIDVTSDAAVGAWEGWGGYGATKAALDHVGAVLAVEHPDLHVHAVDPGDLRTAMHQAAFPGEDIGDRPPPETVAPTIVDLVERRVPSGRHRAVDLVDASVVPA
jgi:NAD(P)-dependent dehydrogenase (short-subunit alcohol dehydrogenase family)